MRLRLFPLLLLAVFSLSTVRGQQPFPAELEDPGMFNLNTMAHDRFIMSAPAGGRTLTSTALCILISTSLRNMQTVILKNHLSCANMNILWATAPGTLLGGREVFLHLEAVVSIETNILPEGYVVASEHFTQLI